MRRITRPVRHGALFAAFGVFRGFVAVTPRRLALAAGTLLGDAAYAFGGRTRRAATRRMADVLKIPAADAARSCREMYRHFAYDLIDLMVFGGWRRGGLARVVKVEGWEELEAALRLGRGVVGLTAHFCVWELFGGYVAARLGGIAVLAHPAYDENFNRLLVRYRERLGVRTIYRQESFAVPMGWLRAGRFLGVLADQDIPDMPSVVVDFLGRPARTPLGPALLARRARAPLVPMYITREKDKNYRVVIEPALAPAPGTNIKAALAQDTAAWSARVAAWVRGRPGQWVWVHDRWRGAA